MSSRGFVKTTTIFFALLPFTFLVYWATSILFNSIFGQTNAAFDWIAPVIANGFVSVWLAREDRQDQVVFSYSSKDEFRQHLESALSRTRYPVADASENQIAYKRRRWSPLLAKDIVVSFDLDRAIMTGPAYSLYSLKLQARKWQQVELVNG